MISTKMVISSTINLLRIFAKQNENNIFKIFQNPTAEGLTKARFLKFHHIYKYLYDIELELIKVWVFSIISRWEWGLALLIFCDRWGHTWPSNQRESLIQVSIRDIRIIKISRLIAFEFRNALRPQISLENTTFLD